MKTPAARTNAVRASLDIMMLSGKTDFTMRFTHATGGSNSGALLILTKKEKSEIQDW